MAPTLAAIDWINGLLVVAFLAISVMMILIVLIQRPQGGGLSGAFGSGAGSGQTAFGARTGDALTIATIIIFVVFLGVAAALNHTIRPPKAVRNDTIAAPASGGAPLDSGDTGAPVPVTTVPADGPTGDGATAPIQPEGQSAPPTQAEPPATPQQEPTPQGGAPAESKPPASPPPQQEPAPAPGSTP